MVISLSCIGRARSEDLGAILPALAEAAETVDLDHSRLAAVLDWVQYRRNFRAAVMVRPFGVRTTGDRERSGPLAEVAIDVRRARDIPFIPSSWPRSSTGCPSALGLIPDIHECIHLEDWIRPSRSVVWSFNRAYWRHLSAWDETFARDYAAALPGGVSDGDQPRSSGAIRSRPSSTPSTGSTNGPSCPMRSACSSSGSAAASRPACGWTSSPAPAASAAGRIWSGCGT